MGLIQGVELVKQVGSQNFLSKGVLNLIDEKPFSAIGHVSGTFMEVRD